MAMDGKDEADWSRYVFNLEEARDVPPEFVKQLRIVDGKDAEFPLKVLEYKNLESLYLSGPGSISEVPEQIGELTRLAYLTITRTSLKRLPQSLFRLPELQVLNLNDNQLEQIPADISLPNLKVAYFDKNKLTTLPESLALQPQIARLSLKNNPWVSLPSAFNGVGAIELILADKIRLLDHEYQGADGKGVVEWDNTPYFVKSDTALQEQMLEAIQHTILEKHEKAVMELAHKAVCLNPSKPDDYSRIGNTRFGGMPDMPEGETYPSFPNPYKENAPYHYLFFAQLNCEELAPLQAYLPRKGLLYFYVEEEEDFRCKVVYHPDAEHLQSAKSLAAIDFNNAFSHEPYKPFTVESRALAALPKVIDDKDWNELAEVSGPVLTDIYSQQVCERLGREGVYREHNQVYYSDMNHSINDCVEGIGAGSPNELAALKCKGDPEDWVVLLRMYSDEKCGFQFFDAGELYFMIHKSDLAKADFSNVYAFADSS